jgi:hypothetical protein
MLELAAAWISLILAHDGLEREFIKFNGLDFGRVHILHTAVPAFRSFSFLRDKRSGSPLKVGI